MMRALVFSIDDAYVMPFKVLWHSLMTTASVPDQIPIFILHEATLSPASITDLTDFFRKYERSADFLDASAYVPDNLPLADGDHVSKATFYRLFIASILPSRVSSVVYLDSDAVVIRSVRELFEVELDLPVAACNHFRAVDEFRLCGPLGGSYFQGGVLVIDLDAWREQILEESFKEIMAAERERIRWWDQDVLNIAFSGKWQRIPVWYNVSRDALQAMPVDCALENARFLHFDGSRKPWRTVNQHPLDYIWYDAYCEAFGSDFDKRRLGTGKAKVTKPLWRRSLALLRSRARCVFLGRP